MATYLEKFAGIINQVIDESVDAGISSFGEVIQEAIEKQEAIMENYGSVDAYVASIMLEEDAKELASALPDEVVDKLYESVVTDEDEDE